MDIYQFWNAVLKQDAAAIRPYFHPEASVKWHNTNECFTVDEFIQANCEYPGQWEGTVERVERLGELMITATAVRDRNSPLCFHAVSFIRLTDDKIASVDEYWGDDGPAPQWRLNKNIGKPIK